MVSREERLAILKQVECGELTIEEGSRRLTIMEEKIDVPAEEQVPFEPAQTEPQIPLNESGQVPQAEAVQSAEVVEPPSSLAGLKKYGYLIVLLPGVVLTVLSAYWMYLGWEAAGPGWGFWLSWIPLLLGILLIVVGWQLSTAPWLHVRIQQKPGEKPEVIRFSIPIPFHLASWGLRIARPWLPEQVKNLELEGMMNELRTSVTAENPLQIQVDEDEEKVELYLG